MSAKLAIFAIVVLAASVASASSLRSKGGFGYPQQSEFRQPQIVQQAAPVQQLNYAQAPMQASYPTKGGLDYQQSSYQAPVKGEFHQPLVQSTYSAPAVQSEFRQPQIVQHAAPVQQLNYAQAPMQTSYPTKGGLDYQQSSYQAPVKSTEIVQSPQQPLVQSTYSAPAVQSEFRQPENVQHAAPVQPLNYAQAPMRSSYPTKGGLDYQQTSYQAPVKGELHQPLVQSTYSAPAVQSEFRQPEIVQSASLKSTHAKGQW